MKDDQNSQIRTKLGAVVAIIALLAIAVLLVLDFLSVPERKRVVILPARLEDVTHEVFGIEDSTTELHPIGLVSGDFSSDSRLLTALWTVENGQIEPLSGTNAGDLGTEVGIAMSVQHTPNGRFVCLETSGHGRLSSGREGGPRTVSIPATYSESFHGEFSRGTYVVYAEGDQKFALNRFVTLKQFTAKNAGRYLVVTVTVRW
jgi:hypothetical protein